MRIALAATLLLSLADVASADRLPLLAKPSAHPRRADALSGLTIYMNKCEAGCNVKPGEDDAGTDTAAVAGKAATLTMHPWKAGEWEGIVQCMKQVYSPYNVNITDVRPVGQVYNEVIVAGGYTAIATDPSCGIVAWPNGTCEPGTNTVAFAFVDDGCYSNYLAQNPDPGGTTAIWETCAVIAQETAHDLGLDHAWGTFDSGQSTCNDPMTYSNACGGEKFFRNDFAPCNGNDGRKKPGCGPADTCASKQNAHLKLLAALGPGTPTTSKPISTLQAPATGATVMATTGIITKASAQRGVANVELWINGYKWGTTKGVAFGPSGQPEAPYVIQIPAGVPDSKLDIVMKAVDDIGAEGDSTPITVTKGKAGGCDPSVVNADGTIDTCLAGMTCDAGKCAWVDANTGAFGDTCTYPQFCMTGDCEGTADQQICTHGCSTGTSDSCPPDYDCIPTDGTNGICFTHQADGGGCCSVGSEGAGAIAAHGGIALATLGLLFARRRRRAS